MEHIRSDSVVFLAFMCVFSSHHFSITEAAAVEIVVFQRVFGSVGDVGQLIQLAISTTFWGVTM